ncbi:MAG: NHLP family bacteriocin export ABC transporter peptidase/permease/ATPase subunit [Clostridiales bacterium]|nr:NHLP family bacteriocin export ABC transporter peptidase/permease/ATPase subunit [Clostridiales bacterium]
MKNSKIKIPSPITKGYAKVPVVMQMEALECGAASLTMILAYYKKWVSLEQIRSDCGVSRDGSKAKNVLVAARSYGLNAKGFCFSVDQIKKNGQFPCIIHWNFNHFLVLDGFKKNKAVLNDPARGRVEVSMEEFDKSFTGICLMFEPNEDFVPGGEKKSTLDFAKKRLKGTAAAIMFVVLTTLITSLIDVINPAFSRVFIDRLLTGENAGWLYPFVFGMSGVALLQIIVLWVKETNTLKLEGKLAIVANSTYMWHVLRMPMEFYSQRMAGDIAQRQKLNEGVAKELINSFAPLVLDAVMMIIYLVVMIKYSVLLAFVGILSVILNLLVAGFISKKRVNIMRVQMRNSGKLSGITVTGIEMIETIKASGAENGFFEKWSGYQAGVNTQNVRYAKLNNYLGAVPGVISSLAQAAVLMLGVYLTIKGEFTVGMILAFQSFLSSFTSPAQKLIKSGQKVQEMRTNMERIEDVMNYKPDVNYSTEGPSDDVSYTKLSGKLEMKNVTFGYSPLEPPLIENFNLTVNPGERIAFVGSSGCGKSTISKLISGLYKPWSGEILFDGKPIDQINRSVFTGSLAVVDQDIILFEDTIAQNIKMWDSSIEDFEMILAARDAQIHEDIMMRDGGYQYKILEGGKDFSGGQRQRIEIARVLAQDPTIIIMDEATSALDAKTEYDVVKSIKDRCITCIVVAHRLSTIRDCDEIIVMDRGKVVERGTHKELYKLGGLYTKLVTSE